MTHASNKVLAGEIDLDLSEDTHISPTLALLGSLDTHMTIDPSLPGKQHGHLVMPYSSQTGPQQLRVPVCCIRGSQAGPTLLLVAGIHGDEYEGALILQRIARELAADSVHGCLLIVPAANSLGLPLGQRCLPVSGEDLDRCFPGQSDGSLGPQLAHEIFERLIRPADLVLDIRSGGQRLNFDALAAVRFMGVSNQKLSEQSPQHEQYALSEAAMIAFGAPNSVRLPTSQPGSCLQASVQAAGKAYVQTELGGGAGCTAQTLEVARVGCFNVLRHMGVLKEEVELRSSRMLEVRDNSFYVHATTSGLLEPHARLGGEVWKGDVLAKLVALESTGAQPHSIIVPRNAVLLAMHHGGLVNAGELVAILADEVQR